MMFRGRSSAMLAAFAGILWISSGSAFATVVHYPNEAAVPGSAWDSFNVTDGFTDFVFASSNGDVNPQSAAHIESLLESPAWFNQPLTYVAQVDSCSTSAAGCRLGASDRSATSNILANVFYIHFGGGGFAFLYPTLINNFSVSGAGSGLSNLRAFNTALTAVPLPAALPLFAAALAGTGLLGWRKRGKAA